MVEKYPTLVMKLVGKMVKKGVGELDGVIKILTLIRVCSNRHIHLNSFQGKIH